MAVAALLQRTGRVSYEVLEKAADVGEPWLKGRYERLHLHTDRFVTTLPYVDWPSFTSWFPSRVEFANYLRGYWRQLGLNVRFNTAVERVERHGDSWSVTLQSGERRTCRHVVVAVGQSNRPNDAPLPQEKGFAGTVMHSAAFTNGAAYAGKRALVVGFGNSAQDIALDLALSGAKVDVAVRNPIAQIERDVAHVLPALSVSMALGAVFLPLRALDWIGAKLSLLPAPPGLTNVKAPKMFTGIANNKPPVIDIGLHRLLMSGEVKAIPPPTSWQGYEVVVKCTGYLPVAGMGLEKHLRDDGVLPPVCADGNLYFVGWNDKVGRVRHMTLDGVTVRDSILASLRK